MGCELYSAGMVDTAQGAHAAGEYFAQKNVDLIVVYVATYATSSQVLPVVQKQRVPVLVLNLQPTPALDYERTDTQEWLANCSACCVPEIACAFTRARVDFNVVSGMLFDDARAWGDVREWIEAAGVWRTLRSARIGFLGHTYPGMLDMYSDFTAVHAQLGSHIEILEMDDLQAEVKRATEAEVRAMREEILATFDIAQPGIDRIAKPVTEAALDWSAQVAVGLHRLVEKFQLDGLTYYYRGLDGNEFEDLGASLIVGNSLLTAKGVPAAGEGDLKTCIAMMIMDRFGAGGSYSEIYAMDFRDQFVLVGHDGPGHVAISDRKPVLRALGLYHGKRGYGVSVEFKVKTGPVTILGVTQTADGTLKMVASQGESLPGPILQIGNTNSRIRFSQDPAEFVTAWSHEGPTHHFALGVGHQLPKIARLARLAGLLLAVV